MAQPERNPLNPREPDGERPAGPGGKRPRFSLSGFYLLAFLMLGFLALQALFWSGDGGRRVDYSAFLAYLEAGQVESFTVTDNLGWRWLFYAGLPFGVVALVFILRYLHLPHTQRRARIDVVHRQLTRFMDGTLRERCVRRLADAANRRLAAASGLRPRRRHS